MRQSKFTEEQMVSIIRESDRDSVSAVAKRHALSEQTIYTWKKRFGTFQADDVRRLKQLMTDWSPILVRNNRCAAVCTLFSIVIAQVELTLRGAETGKL